MDKKLRINLKTHEELSNGIPVPEGLIIDIGSTDQVFRIFWWNHNFNTRVGENEYWGYNSKLLSIIFLYMSFDFMIVTYDQSTKEKIYNRGHLRGLERMKEPNND